MARTQKGAELAEEGGSDAGEEAAGGEPMEEEPSPAQQAERGGVRRGSAPARWISSAVRAAWLGAGDGAPTARAPPPPAASPAPAAARVPAAPAAAAGRRGRRAPAARAPAARAPTARASAARAPVAPGASDCLASPIKNSGHDQRNGRSKEEMLARLVANERMAANRRAQAEEAGEAAEAQQPQVQQGGAEAAASSASPSRRIWALFGRG